MLVIHPKDKTTAFLSMLYEGMDEVRMLDCDMSLNAISKVLHHTPPTERIMILGHGCPDGLMSRKDDTKEVFDRFVITNKHAFHLRNHGGNIFTLSCRSDEFAEKHGLHGLFTGMIISEMHEAEMYGVETTQEELDIENIKLVRRFRQLLDAKACLSSIPKKIQEMDDAKTPLTKFNYSHIYYF